MIFPYFHDLVEKINLTLKTQTSGEDFIRVFQYKRKALRGADRAADLQRLFGNIKEDWAINKGGGPELQYHIHKDYKKSQIRYGLGFNMQYVPHQNDMPPSAYAKPFADAYLALEPKLQAAFPSFSLFEDRALLENPQDGKHVLWGKAIPLTDINDQIFIEEVDFDQMIVDLKEIFKAYVLIYEQRNKREHISMDILEKLNLLKDKKQIILQGPPGTGKTYLAQDLAYQLINGLALPKDEKARKEALDKLYLSGQFRMVQFHPNYGYEDFVRGMESDASEDLAGFSVKDKILASLAKEAHTNYLTSQKQKDELSKEKVFWEQWELFVERVQLRIDEKGKFPISDHVYLCETSEDAFYYTGDNWKNRNRMPFIEIAKLYFNDVKERKAVKHVEGIGERTKQHSTYFFNVLEDFRQKEGKTKISSQVEKPDLKSYVLIIDEINRANLPAVLGELIYALEYREYPVDSMYEHPDSGNKIVLPPNLYIIGTMNTADRSVGQIDYAIRRRFAFIPILPDEQVIKTVLQENAAPALELFHQVQGLFRLHESDQETSYLSPDFMAEDVMIGHSYFLEANEEKLRNRLTYEVIPILKEYIRDGVLSLSAKDAIEHLT